MYYSDCFFIDEDGKNPCAQYLVTNETNSAAFGDLSFIINLENESICMKFDSREGIYFI